MSSRTAFLSRLIGLFSILVSLSMISHREVTERTMTALIHNPPLLLIIGMIALGAGLAIVLSHNVWSGGALPVVITLVGWVILIRGLVILFLSPEAAAGLFEALHFERFFFLYAAVSLIIGIYLSYGGFRVRSR
jgi:hypothetical protein